MHDARFIILPSSVCETYVCTCNMVCYLKIPHKTEKMRHVDMSTKIAESLVSTSGPDLNSITVRTTVRLVLLLGLVLFSFALPANCTETVSQLLYYFVLLVY